MREWVARWAYSTLIPNGDVVKRTIDLLRQTELSTAERIALTGAVLEKLEALPLRAIVENTEQGILIHGKPVDIDKLRVLRESAIAAIDNQAINYMAEQVVWIAVQRGIHNADTPDKLFFYRAAIWFSEQLKAHLQILAGQVQE